MSHAGTGVRVRRLRARRHTIERTPAGARLVHHDGEAEAVLGALGGPATPCRARVRAWELAGVRARAVRTWIRAGIASPEEAGTWRSAADTAGRAVAWRSFGLRAADAVALSSAGLQPDDVAALQRAGATAARLVGLARSGLGPDAIRRWAPTGLSLTEVAGLLDLLAALGVASFTAALILELARGRSKPERDWYEGRAAAESTKTLAWRFAVGGDPFPVDDVDSQQQFIDRVQAVVDTFAELELPAVDAERTQVTPRMLELRSAPLQARRDAYRDGRLREQRSWYVRRSRDHGRYARRWRRFAVGATIAGILGGLARFAGFVDIDFLGFGAAAASAATAWTQLRQHQTLATSYALAAQELALAEGRLPAAAEEAEWALFVSDAEDAISREHTMWLAKRGHPRPS